MNVHKYIGHESQLSGVEEHRLIGGKGDGMRLFQVRNGKGLEFTVSADRCADISRLSYKGDNFGYFSPCGYVAPAYYQEEGAGFLKSFTAGFLTTCGLTAVGSPCTDEGEKQPLHGTIGNTPAERIYWDMDENDIRLYAVINDSGIFSRKLMLYREIVCSKKVNSITINDTIENCGSEISPLMLLYHLNMGYPLLSEKAVLHIPSEKIIPRNEHAVSGLKDWNNISAPVKAFQEQCFYHSFDSKGMVAIFNTDLDKGFLINFDKDQLDYFVQWKMMGEKDYVLGLEPGNCHPDGRDKMRAEGKLKFIEPGETKKYSIKLDIIVNIEAWKRLTGGK